VLVWLAPAEYSIILANDAAEDVRFVCGRKKFVFALKNAVERECWLVYDGSRLTLELQCAKNSGCYIALVLFFCLVRYGGRLQNSGQFKIFAQNTREKFG